MHCIALALSIHEGGGLAFGTCGMHFFQAQDSSTCISATASI